MAKNGNIHPTRIFKTPEDLYEAFEKYKKWAKANPFIIKDWVGKDANEVYREKERCLSVDGFEVYCYKHYGCVSQYFDNKDGYYNDFVAICSRIRREVRADQIEGGMAMIYNASITQRLNGLVEKTESNITGTLNIPKVPDIGNR